MFTLNYYKNLKAPACLENITIPDYVEQVRSGLMVEDILLARQHGKGKLYDRIKQRRPCVSINFKFNGYKNNENIQDSTGLLYFDIDGMGLDELYSLDLSKIYVAHKSFGGKGTCLIVKASGITQENFKVVYQDIATKLGISDIMDTNAIKMVQSTVLSYDPDIYFNENSIVFDEKVSFRGELKREENISPRNDTFLKPKYHTAPRNSNAADLVPENLEYMVFPEGIMTAQVIIPRNIKEGSRTNVLLAELNNLVVLNPWLNYAQVLEKAYMIHNINTDDRLSPKEVQNAVDSIFRYKIEGTLRPINNKIRKVIFKSVSALSREEKIGIVNIEVGKIRTDVTKKKISEAVEGWNCKTKITAKVVAQKINMSPATVKRHWSGVKELVKSQNAKLKTGQVTTSSLTEDCGVDENKKTKANENLTDETITSVIDLSSFIKTVTSKLYNESAIERYFDFFRDEGEQCTPTNICRLLGIDVSVLRNCG
jgi:hypothetical protein